MPIKIITQIDLFVWMDYIILKLIFISFHPLNPLSANPTKWSNTLKQFVGNLPTNLLSVFDRFVKLALQDLSWIAWILFGIFISDVKISHDQKQPSSVPENFAKFTGRHLCQSIFFNKVADLKKRLWHSCFPVNFAKSLRTPFFIEPLWWTSE